MKKRTVWIRWIARIWGMVILLIALSVLAGNIWTMLTSGEGDPYAAEDYPFIENIPPVLMLVSAIGLGIAWRWERTGGLIAVLGQLATLPLLLIHWPIREGFPRYLIAPYGLSAVVAIPGVLFLISAAKAKRVQSASET